MLDFTQCKYAWKHAAISPLPSFKEQVKRMKPWYITSIDKQTKTSIILKRVKERQYTEESKIGLSLHLKEAKTATLEESISEISQMIFLINNIRPSLVDQSITWIDEQKFQVN